MTPCFGLLALLVILEASSPCGAKFTQHTVNTLWSRTLSAAAHATSAELSQAILNSSRIAKYSCAAAMPWLSAYSAWHAAQLHKPHDAKFLLEGCRIQDVVPGYKAQAPCLGIGDRIRAMVEAVNLADDSKRVLLLYWGMPAPLQSFFMPNTFDWTLKPEYGLHNESSMEMFEAKTWLETRQSRVTHKELAHVSDARLVALESNYYNFPCEPGAAHCLGGIQDAPRSCVFHALFKPSPVLKGLISSAQRQLFGSEDVRYVAIHLRLGGMSSTETEDITRFDGLKGLLASLTCARDLAAAHNITAPVLLMTDNAMLRALVANATFDNVIGPTTTAQHVDFNQTTHHIDRAMTSFVDLGLLAHAHCLIGSPSGFTFTARHWGQHSCYILVNKCIEVYSGQARA